MSEPDDGDRNLHLTHDAPRPGVAPCPVCGGPLVPAGPAWRYSSCGFALCVGCEPPSPITFGEEEQRGIKASADLWSIRQDLREEVHRRAAAFWAKRAGSTPAEFPYGVDFTARLYFRFRKRNSEEVADFAREIDGPHHPPAA